MHTCVLVADDRDIYDVLDRYAKYDHRNTTSESRWDYFGIGGRFASALPLSKPRQLRKFFGLLPAGQTNRVSVAKKSEIDHVAFLADPPAALYFRDAHYECPYFAEGEALAEWHAEFRQRFSEIPNETKLQIVDAHS